MSELISFSSIPSKWDWHYENGEDAEYPFTDAQEEAAEFLSKMDWEGGISGLLSYGGASSFPEELRIVAQHADDALETLSVAINDWAAERGVVY